MNNQRYMFSSTNTHIFTSPAQFLSDFIANGIIPNVEYTLNVIIFIRTMGYTDLQPFWMDSGSQMSFGVVSSIMYSIVIELKDCDVG